MDNVSHTHTHLKALRLWPKPSLEDVVVALLTADDVFLVLGLTSSEGKQTKQIDASLKRRWSSWGCCPTCLTCFCPSKNGFGGLVAKSILLQMFTLFWESIKDSHEQTASCVSQKAAPNLWNSHRPVLEEEQLWTPPRSNAARISNCCSQLVAKNPRNSPKCSGRSPPKLMTCKFGIFKTQVHFRSVASVLQWSHPRGCKLTFMRIPFFQWIPPAANTSLSKSGITWMPFLRQTKASNR